MKQESNLLKYLGVFVGNTRESWIPFVWVHTQIVSSASVFLAFYFLHVS